MTKQIRRTAIVVFVLFGALFANLNYLQVLRADDLSENNLNRRQLLRQYEIQRGSILAGEGRLQREIATSVETDGQLRFQRAYPQGPLYGHVTGFQSFIFGRTQLERTFNEFLAGSSPESFVRNLGDLLEGRDQRGDTVVTTLAPGVQETAASQLGDRTGAVVALDTRTGDVLAMVSSPTYDPNLLASHDPEVVRGTWERLEGDPENPRLSRATSELYPPGSAFKLVTAAAALENGIRADDEFDDPRVADLPQTDADIPNFGGGLCNGGAPLTLARALEVSCNTTFATVGLRVGADSLIAQAEAFGLNRDVELALPTATSRIPKELDPPQTGQSAIGQRDVRVTPLQMAMISAAIANGGVVMQPRLVSEVQDFAGRVLRQYPSQPLTLPGRGGPQAVSPANAATLRQMMAGVVERGTGTRAAVPGVRVAGKTGTAQTGEGQPPTVWFVGFAPVDDPRVAVAVVVADEPDATGGRTAAPIAGTVLAAALEPVPGG